MKTAKLVLIRDTFSDDTTLGKLYLNDEYFCETLEDAARAYGVKIPAETAIPTGHYKVKISLSSRFKRKMPMIYTEDNGYELINGGISFKGIRMHGGNTHKNTEGCVLVAYRRVNDKTIQGTAEKDLTMKLMQFDRVTLDVINDQK